MLEGGRIKPREPEIELYKTGFDGVCALNRKREGAKLSDLVEKISDPMVVAIDAPWGAGKSVFLKCWVGAHKLENGGAARTVYYDAFRYDFMDDPLISLTGVISERFKSSDAGVGKWKVVKAAAAKLARPTVRIALSAATAGVSEFTGAAVDAALEAGSDELKAASDNFWEKENGKRAAMQTFRNALREIAMEQRLVVVVDELDRCRPDYALNLLEVIKHFFNVDNVHFVLGVNLQQLSNSVKARYGPDVEGQRYIQKFVTVSMPLKPPVARRGSSTVLNRYFLQVSEQIGLSATWKHDWINQYIGFLDHHAVVTLRDIEKVSTLAMVTPSPSEKPEARLHAYVGLLFFKVIEPSLVELARYGDLKRKDVFKIFDLSRVGKDERSRHNTQMVWSLFALEPGEIRSQKMDSTAKALFGGADPKTLLRDVISETLDIFQIL